MHSTQCKVSSWGESQVATSIEQRVLSSLRFEVDAPLVSTVGVGVRFGPGKSGDKFSLETTKFSDACLHRCEVLREFVAYFVTRLHALGTQLEDAPNLF